MILPTVTITIMIAAMLLIVHLLSNAAVEYEITRDLRKSIDANLRNVSIEDGKLELAEDFLYQGDGVSFLILERDGTAVLGEYPEAAYDVLLDCQVKVGTVRRKVCGDGTYYVRDRWIGKGYILRGIINESDADSIYRKLEEISYAVLVGILCVSLIGVRILSKKITQELKNMCRAAEGIGASRDISSRMEEDHQLYEIAVLAQANNRMLDCLEHMFCQQEQFTSDAAHELRTPVAVILAQCEHAGTRAKSKEELCEILEVIYRQTKKMDVLIFQLLNLSRFDQDRMQLNEEELDLVEIVRSVCEGLQEKAAEKMPIEFFLQDAVTIGDIGLISIVIENFVTNAVKFSRPGQAIQVWTGEEEPGGYPSMPSDSAKVYVRVRDHGIGIAPEDLENIFSRFYRGDKSRNTEGFGLGLPLAEKIVQKHGGRITVQSKVGEGSEFTMYLPKKDKK